MSGFRFDRVVKKADVKMLVPMDAGGEIVRKPVIHCFEFESAHHLQDRYVEELADRDERSAALLIWQEFCKSVKGYEGLPPDFRNFFAGNEIAVDHVVSAVNFLINKLGIQALDP